MSMKHVGTAAPLRQIVLVTGFGAFPGARRNPTATVVAELARHRPRLARLGIALHGLLLPVVYAEIEPTLRAAIERHRPDVVLHLGLAGRRRRISVETRALNRAGPLHPDAARRLPERQVLASGAPHVLRATWPAPRIRAALRRTGLDAASSIDAGDYVCNAALFQSLHVGVAARVGFIHVPKVRQARPRSTTRQPAPSVADLVRAVLTAILSMAAPF